MKKFLLTLSAGLLSLGAFAQADLPMTNLLSGDSFDFEGGTKGGWYTADLDATVVTGGYDSDNCLKIDNKEVGPDYYTAQIGYSFSSTLTPGTYILKFYAKTTAEDASLQVCLQNSSYSGSGYQTTNLTSEWKLCAFKFDVTATDINRLAINMGKFVGEYYLDDIAFGPATPATEVKITNLITGDSSTFEGGSKGGWYTGSLEAAISEGGYDSDKCLEINNTSAGDDYYTAQIGYSFSSNLTPGTYALRFYAKTTAEDASLQVCYQNPSYTGFEYTVFNLTEDWQQFGCYFNITEENINRLAINMGKFVGKYYLDNIEFGPVAAEEEVDPEPEPEPEPEGPFVAPEGYEVIIEGNTADGVKIVKWSGAFENTEEDGTACIKYTNETAGESYAEQLAIDYAYEPGTVYYFTFDVMGTPSETAISTWYQHKEGYKTLDADLNTFTISSDSEWTQVVVKGQYTENEEIGDADRAVINLGAYIGTAYFTNFKIYGPKAEGEGPGEEPEGPFVAPEGYKVIIEGDVADGVSIVKWSDAFENTEEDGIECIQYTNETAGENYSEQLAIDHAFIPEVDYYITFDVMGTPSETAISAWYQHKEGYKTLGYNDFNTFTISSESEWTQVVLKGKYTADEEIGEADRVVINLGAYEGTAYFTNFKVYGPESDGITAVESATAAREGIYNLMGVKVGNDTKALTPGLYIVNGKKVVIR